MEKVKKNLPKLRFPEFNNHWSSSELGNFILSHKSGASLTPRDFTDQSGKEVIPKKAIIAGGKLNLDKTTPTFCKTEFYELNQKSIVDNKYLITTLRDLVPSGPSIGYIVRFEKDVEYLLAQGVYGLEININKLNKGFLTHYSNTNKYRKIMKKIKVGSTQIHIRNKDFYKVKIFYPEVPEQHKIATFLSSVDKKIDQLQNKKELLENYKKGMMQKIFKQEIRFKDENGKNFPEWKPDKLSNIAEIVGGGTPSTTNEKFWNGNISWFTPTEIKGRFVTESLRKISESGLKKSSAKLLPVGTILLTTRATIGETSIALQECTTNQGFQSLIVNKKNNNIFILYWIDINKKEFLKKANGSTFSEISKKEIEKIVINIPTLKEQTKIANFFSAIDDKIDLVATEIDKTSQFKKGLLQQMFV